MHRTSKLDKAIKNVVLPHLMKVLVDKGLVTKGDLSDPAKLMRILGENLTFAVKKLEMIVSYHEVFVEEAARAWSAGKQEIAIVLYSTSIEQLLNVHYRHAFHFHGLSKEQITAIIRTQSFENKLTWLMQVASRKAFPKALATRFRKVIEIRNSIVHYKAVPGRLDHESDSHSSIKRRITQLKRMSIRRDMRLLDEFVWKTLAEQDERFAIAGEAAANIHHYVEQQKQKH
jgi:hypothetical protein